MSIKEVINKISFDGFPMPIKIYTRGMSILVVELWTRDRKDSRKIVTLRSEVEIPSYIWGSNITGTMLRWIMDHVMELIKHELLEHFKYDGKIPLDPHDPQPTSPNFLPQAVIKDLFPGK